MDLLTSKVYKTSPVDYADPTAGQIDYYSHDGIDPQGLFSFSFYWRPKDPRRFGNAAIRGPKKLATYPYNLYLRGIEVYSRILETPEFEGWKMVIYTDAATLAYFKSGDIQPIEQAVLASVLANPKIIIAIVNWPEYDLTDPASGLIENSIMRVMRLKAFWDFPSIMIAIRDADTTEETLLFNGDISNPVNKLLSFETTWLTEVNEAYRKTNKCLFIASQPNYARPWHLHPYGFQTIGAFAGITTAISFPECFTVDIWQEILSFLRGKCKIIVNKEDVEYTGRRATNVMIPTAIGKDEQVLIYVMTRVMFDKTYFVFYEFVGNESVEPKHYMMKDFKRQNALVAAIAEKGFETTNKVYSPGYNSAGINILALSSAVTPPPEERVVTKALTPEEIVEKRKQDFVKKIQFSFKEEYSKLLETIFDYYINKYPLVCERPVPPPAAPPIGVWPGGIKLQPAPTRGGRRLCLRGRGKTRRLKRKL